MHLPDYIKKINASENPLSCHCFVIEGEKNSWIFDVGASNEAKDEINAVEKPKLIVLSHFHQDHIANIGKIDATEIFQGDFTFRHTNSGRIVNEAIEITDGLTFKIFPLPNTHAKGSLGLEAGDYAFLGDAIFPSHKNGHHVYNATLLNEEISVLKNLNAKFFVLAHNDEYIYEKQDIIKRLESVYAKRNPKEAYINLD